MKTFRFLQCKTPGCDRPLYCRGFCHSCYDAARHAKKITVREVESNKGKTCKTEGCDEPAFCKGYCRVCDNQKRKGHVPRGRVSAARAQDRKHRQDEVPDHQWVEGRTDLEIEARRLSDCLDNCMMSGDARVRLAGRLKEIQALLLRQEATQAGEGVGPTSARPANKGDLMTSPSPNFNGEASHVA